MENEKITELSLADIHLKVWRRDIVDVKQGSREQVWTLDELIEAGRWAERIKSEANGETQSNQDFPPIPEGWERFYTLEEWRGGEYGIASDSPWIYVTNRKPDMSSEVCYIQRVKE